MNLGNWTWPRTTLSFIFNACFKYAVCTNVSSSIFQTFYEEGITKHPSQTLPLHFFSGFDLGSGDALNFQAIRDSDFSLNFWLENLFQTPPPHTNSASALEVSPCGSCRDRNVVVDNDDDDKIATMTTTMTIVLVGDGELYRSSLTDCILFEFSLRFYFLSRLLLVESTIWRHLEAGLRQFEWDAGRVLDAEEPPW